MGSYRDNSRGRTHSNSKSGTGKSRRAQKRHLDPTTNYIQNLQRTIGNKAVEGLIQRKALDPLMNAGKVSGQEAKDILNQLMQNKIFANDPNLIRHFSTCYLYMEPDLFTKFILPYKNDPDNIKSHYLGRLLGFGPGFGQGLWKALTDIWDLLKMFGPALGDKFSEIWDDPAGTFKRDTEYTISGYKTFYKVLHDAFKAVKNDPKIFDEIMTMVNGVMDKKMAAFFKQWVEKNKTPFDQGYEIGVLSGLLVGEIIGAVFGGKGLLKIGKVSKLAKIAKSVKFQAILDKLGLGFMKKIISKADDLVKFRRGSWTKPKGWKLPKNGNWSGQVGNSHYIPKDPKSLGLNPGDVIKFKHGYPDFSPWSKGNYTVPGLNGTASDFSKIYSVIAKEKGFANKFKAQQWLRQKQLAPHHAGGNKIELIPWKLHGCRPRKVPGISHQGGAFQLRNY